MTIRHLCLFLSLLAVFPIGLSAQGAPPKIIDCHIHYNGDPAFLQKLLAKLESVDGMAFLLTEPADLPSAEHTVHAHPNRLTGFGEIDLDDPKALEQVDLFHEAGFRGLGELEYTLKRFDDPAYWPIYERAESYRMILLFHTGIVNREHPEVPSNVSADRMRPSTLDLVARRFPKVTVIGAHLGNPDYAWAGEIARWNPNLYFDLSGSSLIKLQANYGFFKSIFWWSGVVSPHTPPSQASAFEKLVFGSDVFGGELEEFDRALDRYHKMLDVCQVPAPAQANIFSGTLWRILNRP